MFKALAIVAAGIALAAAVQLKRSVEVPSWAGSAVCTTWNPVDARSVPANLNALTCPGVADSTLSCDFSSAEPIDVAVDSVCRQQDLPLRPSSQVKLTARTPLPTRVEWLELQGDRVVVVARRELTELNDTTLFASESPNRRLRVSPAGHSPVTVRVNELTKAPPWSVPELTGGELAVLVPSARVRPEGFRLSGPTEHFIKDDGTGLASLPGLSPGDYVLRPRYSGGVEGGSASLRIRSSEATVISVASEPLGAVRVVATQEVCNSTTRIRVTGATFHVLDHGGDCDVVIAGLRPSRYVVDLSLDGKTHVFAREIQVESQQITDVSFGGAPASASGRVLVNGREADGLTIEFHSGKKPVATAVVRNGHFGLVVGEPGQYTAKLRDSRRPMFGSPTAERHVRLAAGENYLEWEVEAAAIQVRLRNWERIEPVELRFQPRGDAVLFGTFDMKIATSDDAEFTVVGLPFGKYRVTATEPIPRRRKTSGPVEVEMTKTRPESEAVLELGSESLTLILRDEAGRPVSQGERILGDELEPGVFRVSIKWGTPVIVAVPGFMPICRLARMEAPTMNVVLTPGRPTEVIFVPGRPASLPGVAFVTPGSDCAVRVEYWSTLVLPEDQPGVGRRLFQSFPAAGQLLVQWLATGQTQSATVPTTGPLILRVPVK